MFEKREPFPWKIPVLILVGVLVLSSGIYIGIKTRDLGKENNNVNVNAEQTKDKNTKEVFQLMESCEIWVEKIYEDGSSESNESMMIGMVPKELLNKDEEEIKEYLSEKYPDRNIESIKKNKIILSENIAKNDPTRTNTYSLEGSDGFITLYKYDSNGNKSLIEKTQIHIDVLPRSVQDELKKGILVNSEDEAYSKLENFGS